MATLHEKLPSQAAAGPVSNRHATRNGAVLGALIRARDLEARYAREGESRFRDHLAEKFRRAGWTPYTEAHCDAGAAGRGRIDLVAVPPLRWPHVDRIAAIGVEAKRSSNLGAHLDELFGKLGEVYIPARRWWRGRIVLPTPTIIVYATPVSMLLDHAIYDWRDTGVRRYVRREVESLLRSRNTAAVDAAIDLTQLATYAFALERMLWKLGAGVLHANGFRSNRKDLTDATDGAPRLYCIGAP